MLHLKQLHHARFLVRDLETSERFAADFGLHRLALEENRLTMRGAGTAGYAGTRTSWACCPAISPMPAGRKT